MLVRNLLRRGLLGVVTAVVSSHLAYAQDRPDHTNALFQIIRQISDDRFYIITKPKYVNGFQKDPNNYVVLTTFTRVFTVSSSTYAKSATSDNPLQGFAERLVLSNLYGHFEPGDSFDESGKFSFLRTEKGWILQEGDTVVENRHTGHADALDEQKKRSDEQRAQEEKVRDREIVVQQQNATELHLTEVHNACASGQQVRVATVGRVGLIDEKNHATWYGPDPGQVVLCDAPAQIYHIPGRPDQHNDYMCHIKYSNGKQVVTGYVNCPELFVIKQSTGK